MHTVAAWKTVPAGAGQVVDVQWVVAEGSCAVFDAPVAAVPSAGLENSKVVGD